MDCNIRLAGVVLHIHTLFHHTLIPMLEYADLSAVPDAFVTITSTDIDKEWSKSSVIVDIDDVADYAYYRRKFEKRALYSRLLDTLLSYSIINMHGVVITDGNYAYMISAPEGEGKTTRALLFIRSHPNFHILNGDKPLIRVEEDRVVACGSPWKGKEGYGINEEVPLKAIFLLERSKKTEIVEISMREAIRSLISQTYVSSNYENTLKTIELINRMGNTVRFFFFHSTPTAESVEIAIQSANN